MAGTWTDGSFREEEVTYGAFGSPSGVAESGLSGQVSMLYAGRDFDSTSGLYYNRARWFSPELGRFVSEDPIGFAAGDTNVYRYVFNSPANGTDPSGRAANLIAGGIGAIAGAVIGGTGYYLFTPAHQRTTAGFWASVGVGAAAGGLAGLTFGASLAATGGGFGGFVVASGAAGTVGGATAGGLNAGVQTGFTDAGAIAQGAAYGGAIGGVGGLTFGLTAGGAAAFLPGGVASGALAFGVGGIASDFAAQRLALGLGVQQGGYDWRRTAFAGVVGAAGGAFAGKYDPSLLGVSGTGSLRGIGNSLRHPLASTRQFVNNTPMARWIRSPRLVGPKTLELQDVSDIQRIVEKYQTRIDVGGSSPKSSVGWLYCAGDFWRTAVAFGGVGRGVAGVVVAVCLIISGVGRGGGPERPDSGFRLAASVPQRQSQLIVQAEEDR